MADQLAQHAARRARQFHPQRVHAQVFQPHAAGEQQHEAEAANNALVLVLFLDFPRQQELLGQAAIAFPDQAQQAQAPPPGGKTEDEQQQVGQPGAGAAAQIVYARHHIGVRPAWVGLGKTEQNQHEIDAERSQREPARFGQQPHQPVRQGLALGHIAGISIGRRRARFWHTLGKMGRLYLSKRQYRKQVF